MYAEVMGFGSEATGLGFVCFVVINPCALSANRVDFGLFLFNKFSNFTPPPQTTRSLQGAISRISWAESGQTSTPRSGQTSVLDSSVDSVGGGG